MPSLRGSPMKLLVVEDEGPTAAFLRRGLAEEGFAVDVAGDAAAAEAAVAATAYDAIVLDVSLPGGVDGFELCRRWRGAGVDVPILFLTARDDVADRVRGFSLGADDYLVKPFAFAEVVARVRALLRRGTTVLPTVLRVGDLEVDPARFSVRRGGHPIALTAKEFAILEYLARHAGELVTRSQLLDECWDRNYDGLSNLVDVYVSRVRRKIDTGEGVPLLHTVRGAGFVLASEPPC